MMLNGKKGLQRKYLMEGILVIISVVLIVGGVGRTVPIILENHERGSCRTSVEINEKRLVAPIVPVEIVGETMDVNCKVIPKEITGDTEEEVFGQLADLLVMAWHDFGRGKKKIFKDETLLFCSPRYSPVAFKEKDQVYTGFYHYLATEHPLGNEDETYAEVLMNRQLTPKEVQQFSETIDFINSNVDYAIVFTLAKESQMRGFWHAVVGGAIVGVATAIAVTITVLSAGTGTPLAIAIVVGSTALAAGIGGAGGLGVHELTSGGYKQILDEDITMAFGIGSNQGDKFASRLWLIPQDKLADLDCESVKLKRYVTRP